jgi:hypothetical protein
MQWSAPSNIISAVQYHLEGRERAPLADFTYRYVLVRFECVWRIKFAKLGQLEGG